MNKDGKDRKASVLLLPGETGDLLDAELYGDWNPPILLALWMERAEGSGVISSLRIDAFVRVTFGDRLRSTTVDADFGRGTAIVLPATGLRAEVHYVSDGGASPPVQMRFCCAASLGVSRGSAARTLRHAALGAGATSAVAAIPPWASSAVVLPVNSSVTAELHFYAGDGSTLIYTADAAALYACAVSGASVPVPCDAEFYAVTNTTGSTDDFEVRFLLGL
jgi:hypothetical protein